MDRILKPIRWIENAIAGLSLGVVSIIIFCQVISRYFFEYTPIWSEELSRFLIVWSIFIGVSIGVRENRHIGVDALIRFLPARLKMVFECLLNTIGIVVIGTLVYTSIQFIQHTMEFEQLSPAMRIPMYIPYLAMPVGLSLSIVHFLVNIVRLFSREEADVTHLAAEKEPAEALF